MNEELAAKLLYRLISIEHDQLASPETSVVFEGLRKELRAVADTSKLRLTYGISDIFPHSRYLTEKLDEYIKSSREKDSEIDRLKEEIASLKSIQTNVWRALRSKGEPLMLEAEHEKRLGAHEGRYSDWMDSLVQASADHKQRADEAEATVERMRACLFPNDEAA